MALLENIASSRINQFKSDLLAIQDRVCKLQQDLVSKEDYINYLEKEISIQDEELDPLRTKISNLIKQLENVFKESEKRENYIDYLKKQLAFFQNEIDKLNKKILVLYRSEGSLLHNKNSNDTIDIAQQPGSPRLSLPKNQATIQKHRITREVNSIREYFERPITIAPSLDDIKENLDIISDAGERFERLVLQIYPRANARAINAENRVANLQAQLINLQTKLADSQTQLADSQTQLAILQNDYDLLYQAYRAHKLNYHLLKATCIEKNKHISELLQEKFVSRLLNRQFQIQAQKNSQRLQDCKTDGAITMHLLNLTTNRYNK